jgi:hypothetical protein
MATVPQSILDAIFRIKGTDPLTQSISTLGPNLGAASQVLGNIRRRKPVGELFPQLGKRFPEIESVPLEEAQLITQIQTALSKPEQQRALAELRAMQSLQQELLKSQTRESLEEKKASLRPTETIVDPTTFETVRMGRPSEKFKFPPRTQAITAKQNQTLVQTDAAIKTINALEETFNQLQRQGKTGLRLRTLGTKIGATTEQDPIATKYDKSRKALTAFVGRNIGNDVGNFAVRESEQYIALIPSLFSSEGAAKERFDVMRQILENKRESILNLQNATEKTNIFENNTQSINPQLDAMMRRREALLRKAGQ